MRCISSDITVMFRGRPRVTSTAGREGAAEPEPSVVDVLGEAEPNGRAIVPRIQRSAQGQVDLCLHSEDVQYFVSVFLALACETKCRQSTEGGDVPPSATTPLPITAINVGQATDDENFVMRRRGRVDYIRPTAGIS
jgi:hypothetical protein